MERRPSTKSTLVCSTIFSDLAELFAGRTSTTASVRSVAVIRMSANTRLNMTEIGPDVSNVCMAISSLLVRVGSAAG
jgi:hypothetical protein